jgi:hypothetical protein
MTRKINVTLLLKLRDAHMSRNDIASAIHISRNSVSDVFHIANEKGITYQDVHSLGDNEAYDMFFPEKHATEDLLCRSCVQHGTRGIKESRCYIKAPLGGGVQG